MQYPKLFESCAIGTLKIKNRTSMAPMGPIGYADAFGGFNQRLQDYYAERAKNDVGLIITGICSVDVNIEGMPEFGIPSPTTNPLAFIHSTRSMNDRIHAHSCKIFLQLTGGLGRSALPGFIKTYLAPSEQGNRFDPNLIHREITVDEIKTLIQKFIMSAVIAKKSGFDGVEIHAVHEGYLLDQFAINIYNKRTDEYGGSLENRLRIPVEIIKGIKAACGKDFPVSMRYSLKSCMKSLRQGGLPEEIYQEAGRDIDEGIEVAKLLEKAGYDVLNVDAGTYDSWYWNHPPMYFDYGVYNSFGEILKKHVSIPIILAGRMDEPTMANNAIGTCCDMVSYGRPLLADAEYVTKIKYGKEKEIRPCLGCHEGCLGRIANGPISCAVNPACGREEIYGLSPTLIKKNILIIGGGVAGMEVARVSALRGHSVTLVEKSKTVGGNLIPGGMPNFKHHDHLLIDYYQHQLELLKVTVKLDTEITSDTVKNYTADIIIIATGSTPIELEFKGNIQPVVAETVLMGGNVGKNVVIVGAGLVGCETALWLTKQEKNVCIIEMTPHILGGHGTIPHMNEFMLVDLLKHHEVNIHTNATISNTNNQMVTVKTENETLEIPCDTLITCVGYRSNNKLFDSIKNSDTMTYNIGDSSKVHNIMYAIWDAYELARKL